MSKPTLGLRKPPVVAPVTDADAFVFPESSNSQAPKSPSSRKVGGKKSRHQSASPSDRGIVVRADGRRLLRAQLYMPEEVKAALAVHCAKLRVNESDFVTQLVRESLGL